MDFIYDGRSSKEFNFIVKSVKRNEPPERDIETIPVPGGDGALYIDNGSYGPRKVEIEGYIKNNINKYAELIDSWLYRKFLMRDLFFTDETDIFYTGMVINKISFSETLRKFDLCKITFECKPYKQLFSGEEIVTINKSSILFNPTAFTSKPLFRIFGSGDITININNRSTPFKGIENFIEVDSDVENCYKTVNEVITYENSKMYTPKFSYLDPEENTISWVGNVNKIEIIPRWRII